MIRMTAHLSRHCEAIKTLSTVLHTQTMENALPLGQPTRVSSSGLILVRAFSSTRECQQHYYALSSGQFHCDGRYKQKDLWLFKLPCFLEKYPQEIIPVYENCQCPSLFDATDKSNWENLWLDR